MIHFGLGRGEAASKEQMTGLLLREGPRRSLANGGCEGQQAGQESCAQCHCFH
jgi:hypothetical protein